MISDQRLDSLSLFLISTPVYLISLCFLEKVLELDGNNTDVQYSEWHHVSLICARKCCHFGDPRDTVEPESEAVELTEDFDSTTFRSPEESLLSCLVEDDRYLPNNSEVVTLSLPWYIFSRSRDSRTEKRSAIRGCAEVFENNLFSFRTKAELPMSMSKRHNVLFLPLNLLEYSQQEIVRFTHRLSPRTTPTLTILIDSYFGYHQGLDLSDIN